MTSDSCPGMAPTDAYPVVDPNAPLTDVLPIATDGEPNVKFLLRLMGLQVHDGEGPNPREARVLCKAGLNFVATQEQAELFASVFRDGLMLDTPDGTVRARFEVFSRPAQSETVAIGGGHPAPVRALHSMPEPE